MLLNVQRGGTGGVGSSSRYGLRLADHAEEAWVWIRCATPISVEDELISGNSTWNI